MCFYDQHRFECGDWKWGSFREHCAVDFKLGETCGTKLIMHTIPVGRKCRLCRELGAKKNKRTAETKRTYQLENGSTKDPYQELDCDARVRQLDTDISKLMSERDRRLARHNNFDGQGQNSRIGAQPDLPGSQSSKYAQPAVLGLEPVFQLIRKRAITLGLPVTFETPRGPATVMAVPDSGSDLNVISLDLANHLGYRAPCVDSQERRLRLLDGRTVVSHGIVRAVCRFGKTFYTEPKNFHCVFQVLRDVISPLIMSFSFLQMTETFTKNRHRLEILPLCPGMSPKIQALGRAQRRLKCTIDGEDVEALADSGSDVDVVSLAYAQKRRWPIHVVKQHVLLADGRMKAVVGVHQAQLCVGSNGKIVASQTVYTMSKQSSLSADEIDEAAESGINKTQTQNQDDATALVRHVINTTFIILDGISEDALIGAASIETLKVFSDHSNAFSVVVHDSSDEPDLHRISLDKEARKIISRIKAGFDGLQTPENDRRLMQTLNDADQRENARREAADSTSASLSGDAKVQFDAEEQQRRRGYDEYRVHLLQALSSTS